MHKTVIFSDSTCDLPKELIEKLDIKIVPLYVNFDEETYLDGIEIDTDALYEKVKSTNAFPKTAAPSVYDFEKAFKPYIEQGFDIFYTGISSKMSVSMTNAINTINEFEQNRIFVSDSLNLSSAIGLLVIKACGFRDEGLSAKEIKEKIDELAPRVKAGFVVKTMDYLHKGGRCSSVQKFFGTFLKIKLFIRTKNGSMFVHKKPRGKFISAVDIMIQECIEDLPKIDPFCVMVTHSNGDETAPHVIERLKEAGIKNILVTKAGCVISSHCGEGTIGILYILNEKWS